MLVSLVIEIPSSLFSPFCKFFFLSWHLSSIDLAIVYTLIKRHYYNYYLTTLILFFFSFKFLGTPIILKNLTNYMTACWTLLEKITHILGWVSSYSLSRTVNDHSTVCSIIYSFSISNVVWTFMGFPGGSAGKEYACNAKELGSIPGFGRSPGGGHSNPLQYSYLENSMDRGA